MKNITDLLALQMPADEIPTNSLVRKPGGAKQYTLIRELKIYGAQPGVPSVITGFFLVSDGGQINQIEAGLALCWIVRGDELLSYLNEIADPMEDK